MKKKSQPPEKAQKLDLGKDIWPDERSVFERPERLQYVRKLVQPQGCVFCHCAKSKNRRDALVLYKGKRWMVVLNKYPYNNGHLLIIPKRHVGDFLKISDSDLQSMNLLLKQCLKILKKAYQPQGFNVGLNLGKVAGAGIPDHVHQHVIPRWGGDTNFFPLIAQTKLVVETVDDSFERLRPEFEKLEARFVV